MNIKKFVKIIPNFLSLEECQTVLSCHRDLYYQDHCAIDEGSQSSFNFFKDKENNEFLTALDTKLNFVDRLFKFIEVSGRITNVWLNKQTKNSMLSPHVHNDCDISGVLYIKLDEDSSGIKFTHLKEYVVKPEVGTMLIFPNWLTHGGSENNLSEERIVLGFNIIKNNKGDVA